MWISTKFVHMIPLGSKLGLAGRKLEHKNKDGKIQNYSSLKLEGLEHHIWYIASPCGPIPSVSI